MTLYGNQERSGNDGGRESDGEQRRESAGKELNQTASKGDRLHRGENALGGSRREEGKVTLSRERERALWATTLLATIAAGVIWTRGEARYQFHRIESETSAIQAQVFDTRTGNIITYAHSVGGWTRSDLRKNGGRFESLEEK